jgi:hypothetical protein
LDGRYQIVSKKRGITWSSLLLQSPAESLRVEVDATLRKGSPTDDSVGAGCFLADAG